MNGPPDGKGPPLDKLPAQAKEKLPSNVAPPPSGPTLEHVSQPEAGGLLGGHSMNIQVSADARAAVFHSTAQLTADDTNGVGDIYHWTRDAGLALVSVGSVTGYHFNQKISADGKSVTFATEDQLLPDDSNGVWDVYHWSEATGLAMVSQVREDGQPGRSNPAEFSADGTALAFTSEGQLSPGDTNAFVDVYVWYF